MFVLLFTLVCRRLPIEAAPAVGPRRIPAAADIITCIRVPFHAPLNRRQRCSIACSPTATACNRRGRPTRPVHSHRSWRPSVDGRAAPGLQQAGCGPGITRQRQAAGGSLQRCQAGLGACFGSMAIPGVPRRLSVISLACNGLAAGAAENLKPCEPAVLSSYVRSISAVAFSARRVDR